MYPGTDAPEFELLDLENTPVKLSNFKGKGILLVFFASWCKPCRDEAPSLELLNQRLQGTNFQLISIAIDDDIDSLKSFKKDYSLTFPILNDSKGTIRSKYNIKGIPESYIINKEGKLNLFDDPLKGLVLKITGPREWNDANVQNSIIKAAGL